MLVFRLEIIHYSGRIDILASYPWFPVVQWNRISVSLKKLSFGVEFLIVLE